MSERQVRETYRELATERTPEHLDHAVLAEAARAARPRYSRLIAWTRPLAWAATVMLSVALVLELTRTPAPEPNQQLEADQRQVAPNGADTETAPLQERADRERIQAAPEILNVAPPATVGRTLPSPEEQNATALRSSAKQQTVSESELEKREAEFDASAFEPQDPNMLDRAEEMMQLQSGSVAAEAEAARAFDAAMTPTCDANQTSEPETWLACIEQLEQLGFSDEAERQRELLAEEFPDFEHH